MDIALVRLLQLASPLLPVGAFAYSQGLESAVEEGFVSDEESTFEWVNGVLNHAIKQLDLATMHYVLQALSESDSEAVAELNAAVLAFRETSELRTESKQLARALQRLLIDLEYDLELLSDGDCDWVTMFAYACHLYQINIDQAMLGYAWSWCENQVQAAVKLVPLGQTSGQRLLLKITEQLPHVVTEARQIKKHQIGATAPHLAILSSQHETQYSRLFRS